MNISDRNIQATNQNYNINVTQNTSGAKETSGATVVNSANNAVAQIPEGNVFQGKIVDINNNQISVQIDGAGTMQAKLAESMSLNIGDELNFLVKENDGSTVFLKPVDVDTNSMRDNTLSRVLEMNNFSPSEKNYQIAESMMNHNMPLDKASMQKVMQQSYKFPDASIDNLVNMNKLGIPVNESTISQYNDFISNNHQLSNNISDVANSVSDIVTNGDANTFSEVMNIISDEADMANVDPNMLENEIAGENPANAENISAQNENPEIVNNNLLNANPEIEKNSADGQNMTETKMEFSINENLADNKEIVNDVLNKLSDLGADDKVLNKIADKSGSETQLLNNISELIEKTDLKNQDISELLQSKSFGELVSNSIKKKFSLDPEKMENPKEVSDLYKNIYEKTQKLMDSFASGQSSGNSQSSLNENGKSVQERIDFVQNLNELFGYTQIPVNMSGQDMNSELYVYMNKHKKIDSSKEVSALLHLDMDHLGATDVHVSLSESTVTTRFYVDDEESAKVIDEHMTILEKAINEAGYSLNDEVVTRKSSPKSSGNMIVDQISGVDLEQSIKRYSFDMRS